MTHLHEHSSGGIWIGERPQWFGGVRLRARMTVVRLADGRLWVHSCNEPTTELRAELDRLGEVAWIIVPNKFHHIHAPTLKAHYPEAQVIGPETALARNKLLSLDVKLGDGRLQGLVPEFSAVHLGGVPFLDETLFFHQPTGTLIGADIMMCGCARDHFSWRWVSKFMNQYEHFRAPPDVRWNTKPSPDIESAFGSLSRLPVKRILVAHSDALEDRPVEQLREAWSFLRA